MDDQKMSRRDKIKRGIYILPNAITSLNLFCGFIAIISAIDERFEFSAVAILVAVIFDSLDGKIARATHTTSQFGIEYDSLADLVSFGLAPSLMMYLWVLPKGRIGWLAAFLFTSCGALRLARFNSMAEETPSSHFIGLPIPAAATMCSTTVLFCTKFAIPAIEMPVVFLLGVYFLSFLMVSTIKYESFKKAELFKKMKFNVLVGLILVFIVIAQKPQLFLFSIGLIYVSSGPIHSLVLRVRSKHEKKVKTHKL
ncbi:MAG: CDP-diacylglycerol--serine O-phosphatidyltransferase [Proteobacteria bacterium]|nr:CDP-diacylglycerol--serine O-phosphatidyltransferase [Pseudomonadota bacterium]